MIEEIFKSALVSAAGRLATEAARHDTNSHAWLRCRGLSVLLDDVMQERVTNQHETLAAVTAIATTWAAHGLLNQIVADEVVHLVHLAQEELGL